MKWNWDQKGVSSLTAIRSIYRIIFKAEIFKEGMGCIGDCNIQPTIEANLGQGGADRDFKNLRYFNLEVLFNLDFDSIILGLSLI